jgi:ferredoxin-type protein NapH
MKRGVAKITIVRRVVQLLFLALILYGAVFGVTQLIAPKVPEYSDADAQAATINSNLEKDPRANIYLPIHSCKNTNKNLSVFKGCSMFMMTEVLVYQNYLGFAIPIFFLFASAFLFGRTWCGWACPMGFFQEILDWIRGMFKISYIKLSRVTNRVLRKIRWGWLASILLISFTIALPIFATIRKDLHNVSCLTCPTRYALLLFPKVSPQIWSFNTTFYTIGSIILFLFLGVFVMSFFVRRFWCRLCPNGSFLALFNKGCLTTKEKDMQKCTKCGICYAVCPMDNEDVYTVKNRKVVNSKNCVMCFECVQKCPENDCLKVKFGGKTIIKSKYR